MIKPRLTRWRCMFALLLGAGTWWAIGWWLSPPVHLHLSYPIYPNRFLTKRTSDEIAKEIASGQNVFRYHVQILDKSGKFLYLEQLSGDKHYEVFDLTSRQCIARHTISDSGFAQETIADQHPLLADESDTVFLLTPQFAANRFAFSKVDSSKLVKQLWAWNPLTNQTKVLKQFPYRQKCSLSKDGSTLLEIEQTRLVLPTAFVAPGLDQCLSSLAQSNLGIHDLAVMRISSLPALTVRSTIVLPWMYRRDQAEPTRDGAYLVLPDCMHLGPFENQTREYFQLNTVYRGSRLAMFPIWLPKGIRVYQTSSGQLVWEKKGYEGNYALHETESPAIDVLRFEAGGPKKYFEQLPWSQRGLTLHLPSRTLLPGHLLSSSRLDATHLQRLQLDRDNDQTRKSICITDSSGNSTELVSQINEHGLNFNKECCITGAPHYFDERFTNIASLFPAGMSEFLARFDAIKNWLQELHQELCVVDYRYGRKLWSMAGSMQSPLQSQVTDHWLIVTKTDSQFHVYLYRLPFPSWSPWWARLASMLVFLIVCSSLRQRRVLAEPRP